MKTIFEFLQKKKITKAESDYEAVDLGLSVKWASCNVGAKKPGDYGLLFQWGRTDGYKFGDENHNFLTTDEYLSEMNKKYSRGSTLDLADDAANINMGGKWRMPTEEEMQELLTLDRKYVEQDGNLGIEFRAKNGNSIFIPFAGYYRANAKKFSYEILNYGYMWTSSCQTDMSAMRLRINKTGTDVKPISSDRAFSVRGVCK